MNGFALDARSRRPRTLLRYLAIFAACGVWLAFAVGPAFAQAPARAKTSAEAAAERTRASLQKAKKQGPRKGVLRLEGDVIEGKVQKPEAFYLLQRTSLSFEGLQLKTNLVPKIVRSLKKSPF